MPLPAGPLQFDVEFRGVYDKIPPHMQEVLRRYIVQGLEPGNFLKSVISNDLRGATGSADEENLPLLKLYVQWLYNEAPGNCWGSVEVMHDWMRERQKEREV